MRTTAPRTRSSSSLKSHSTGSAPRSGGSRGRASCGRGSRGWGRHWSLRSGHSGGRGWCGCRWCGGGGRLCCPRIAIGTKHLHEYHQYQQCRHHCGRLDRCSSEQTHGVVSFRTAAIIFDFCPLGCHVTRICRHLLAKGAFPERERRLRGAEPAQRPVSRPTGRASDGAGSTQGAPGRSVSRRRGRRSSLHTNAAGSCRRGARRRPPATSVRAVSSASRRASDLCGAAPGSGAAASRVAEGPSARGRARRAAPRGAATGAAPAGTSRAGPPPSPTNTPRAVRLRLPPIPCAPRPARTHSQAGRGRSAPR